MAAKRSKELDSVRLLDALHPPHPAGRLVRRPRGPLGGQHRRQDRPLCGWRRTGWGVDTLSLHDPEPAAMTFVHLVVAQPRSRGLTERDETVLPALNRGDGFDFHSHPACPWGVTTRCLRDLLGISQQI